jgi:hypothetical protein
VGRAGQESESGFCGQWAIGAVRCGELRLEAGQCLVMQFSEVHMHNPCFDILDTHDSSTLISLNSRLVVTLARLVATSRAATSRYVRLGSTNKIGALIGR